MSHELRYSIYPENVDKKEVQAEWDEYAAHEDWQEGCSGLPRPIRWLNAICEDEDDAYEFIEKNDRRCYDQLAVRFKEYPKPKETREITELKRRKQEGCDRLAKAIESAKIQHRTSAKIGCPKCGSQLALKYLHGQTCPLCREDLRSPTNLDRIEKANANLADIEKKLKEAEEKESRKLKPSIKWLVKIEYHT